jgi:putative SOS response-associated peptidase YedK
MCGRYAQFLPPEAIAQLFQTVNPWPNFEPSWNLAPSQNVPVVRLHPRSGERHLDMLRWGLIPHFTTDPKGGRKPTNARAETVAAVGLFRGAFAARRCLVPGMAFYEWATLPTGKQPFAFVRRDDAPIALGGLWEGWKAPDGETVRSFCLITTAANATVSAVHDRMPVMIEPEDWPIWLGEAEGDASALLRPAADDVLRGWPVSRTLNKVGGHDGPELLAPIEASA